LNHFIYKNLDIIGKEDTNYPSDLYTKYFEKYDYNLFDETFLLDNVDKFSEFISYNIITNEILLKTDSTILLYSTSESDNLLAYCNQLISCLQYERRISGTIAGFFFLIYYLIILIIIIFLFRL
jgi:hypothetical protein